MPELVPDPDLAAVDVALLAAPSPFSDPVVRLDPDRPLPPDVAHIHGAVRAALREAIAVVGAERRAQMVLVAGDPGQGKTHLLAQLRHAAEGAYTCVDVPPLKDAGAPFAHVLRYVVQGLAVAGHLQRLCWDTVRRIATAVRDDARAHDDDDIADRVDDALLGGDAYVGAFRTLAQQDPGLGALLYQRGRHLAPLHGLYAELGRVLCRITDRDAEPAIIDWLRGAELADDDLTRLGVARGVDGEQAAFEVLRGLAQCTTRPLVLCLDQIESTSGLLGAAGVAKLFTALMELYQQAPVCIVLMCQTQQWSELRRDVPAAAVDRVKILPPLSRPTAAEAIAVVARRLAPVWEAAGVTPPEPTYPFGAAMLTELCTRSRPTIRQVLLECDERLGAMRRAGAVVAQAVAAPAAAAVAPAGPPPSPPSPDVALRAARDKYVRTVAERRDLQSPSFRQELLRDAIVDVLRGAQRLSRKIGGVVVAGVIAPPKPDKGPRPPVVVTLDGPGGVQRLAFDVHSESGSAAYKALERLREHVVAGQADLAVLLREADAPLGDGAKRSHEVAAALAERGGGVVYVDREAVQRLVGAELMLDAAGASEVLVGEASASPDDALAFLLEVDDLGTALVPLVSRASTSPPRGRRAAG